ncbi:hypothetical protein AMTR_s00097p00170670 [Amborella trichopoda]|uniref:Uncharacterized protein n=1 Tax=Amborella trichopoda TaxID=13333 RepID=W1P2H6_AMBTC|nr:hypothetical protein AMTR_s00097p00170670 [Amborella trichopoda]
MVLRSSSTSPLICWEVSDACRESPSLGPQVRVKLGPFEGVNGTTVKSRIGGTSLEAESWIEGMTSPSSRGTLGTPPAA